jgi:hypothetical protein
MVDRIDMRSNSLASRIRRGITGRFDRDERGLRSESRSAGGLLGQRVADVLGAGRSDVRADGRGRPLNYNMLRNRFDAARAAADPALSDWQFRDLRAKTASDSESLR